MSDSLNLDEALDVAKQMRNHFRAFEKLHSLLLLIAEKRQGVEEAEKQKTLILAEIPAIQGRVDQMLRDHDARKAKLAAEYEQKKAGVDQDFQTYRDSVEQNKAQVAIRATQAEQEAQRRVAEVQKAAESQIFDLDRVLGEVRFRVERESEAVTSRLEVVTADYRAREEEYKVRIRGFEKDEAEAQRKLSVLQEEWETLRSRVSKLL